MSDEEKSQISASYQSIMNKIIGSSVFGLDVEEDSEIKTLVVAAYYAGFSDKEKESE